MTTDTLSHERWVRLPTRGQCPFTGLTRSAIYALINEGKIKSSCLKKPGSIRGIRLVWLPSLLAYIERHVE